MTIGIVHLLLIFLFRSAIYPDDYIRITRKKINYTLRKIMRDDTTYTKKERRYMESLN